MNYLFSVPQDTDGLWTEDEPRPGGWVFSMRYNNGVDQWLYLSPNDETDYFASLGVTLTRIGQWENDGALVPPLHEDYTVYIRPFGNEGGESTDELDYHHFQKHEQRTIQEVALARVGSLPQYPADNQPIVLTMERFWENTEPWTGWSWRAVITFADPTREPTNRAILIYNDLWEYQYSPGKMIAEVIPDPDGGPAKTQWVSSTPLGRATPEKEDIYFCLALGSLCEGRMVLPLDSDSLTRLFWQYDQGLPAPALDANIIPSSAGGETLATGWIDNNVSVIESVYQDRVTAMLTAMGNRPSMSYVVDLTPGQVYTLKALVNNENIARNLRIDIFDGDVAGAIPVGAGNMFHIDTPSDPNWQEVGENFIAASGQATVVVRIKKNRTSRLSWLRIV